MNSPDLGKSEESKSNDARRQIIGLLALALAVVCLITDAWLTVASSRAAYDELVIAHLFARSAIIFFALTGIAFLFARVFRLLTWKRILLTLGGALIAVTLFDVAFAFLPAPQRIRDQIWWEKGVVVVNQLDERNGFDPSKPFEILNSDGSRWLVPNGKFISNDGSVSPTPSAR